MDDEKPKPNLTAETTSRTGETFKAPGSLGKKVTTSLATGERRTQPGIDLALLDTLKAYVPPADPFASAIFKNLDVADTNGREVELIWGSLEQPKEHIVDVNPQIELSSNITKEESFKGKEPPKKGDINFKGEINFIRKNEAAGVGSWVMTSIRQTPEAPVELRDELEGIIPVIGEDRVLVGYVNDKNCEVYYLGSGTFEQGGVLEIFQSKGGLELSEAKFLEDIDTQDSQTKEQILAALDTLPPEFREKVSSKLVAELEHKI